LRYRFGGPIWSGLYMEGFIFGILRYFGKKEILISIERLNQEPLDECPWKFSLIHTTSRG